MTALVELAPGWLQAAADPDRVAEGLEATVAELGTGGSLRLEEVGLSWRLRKDERRWRGTVRVTTAPRGGGPKTLTRLVARLDPPGSSDHGNRELAGPVEAPFGQPGWSCRLPDLGVVLSCEQDELLPALPWLTDPEQALPLLGQLLAEARPGSAAVTGCAPQVLRYKLGSRCTVGYDLETAHADGGVPSRVIAKVYAGRKGTIAHEAMTALWASPLRTSSTVSIAEPLGYDPARRVLLQGPVPGVTPLKRMVIEAFQGDDVDPDGLEPLVRKSAKGLADLHRCGVSIGQPRRWEDDLDELTSRRNRVLGVVPDLASYGADLIAALERLDRAAAPDPDVPCHGSFRAAQVLVDGGEIGFIDFDSFAQGEPALDVAEFAFRLEQLALVKTAPLRGSVESPTHRAAVDQLTAAFLDEYRRHADVSQDRIVLWWTVAALSLVFSSFTKLKLARLPVCMDLVETIARRAELPAP